MQSLTQLQNTNTTIAESKNYIPRYIFVLQLHTGEFVVGHANNACRRIASLNSGCNPAVKALSVNRVVGIKEQNEERSLAAVVSKFCDTYGESRVIAI